MTSPTRLLSLALAALLSGCGAMIGTGSYYAVLSTEKDKDSNGRPAASFAQPTVGQNLNDRVSIRYLLIDSESDPVDVVVEYSLAGAAFQPATPIADYGHDGVVALEASPSGTEHLFVWHSRLDVGDVDFNDVQIRIRATDSHGAVGADSLSPSFRLLNRHIATFAGGEVQDDVLIAPSGLWLDESSNQLYVTDSLAAKVYTIDLMTLALTRVAGNEFAGFDQDNVPAASTSLAEPNAITLSGDSLFVGTSFRVREISQSTGFIRTAAGTGEEGTDGDDDVPENAEIEDEVVGLDRDVNGNIYFTDEHRLRVINRQGVDILVAGNTVRAGTLNEILPSVDPGPEAWLRIKLDASGTAYVVSEEEVWALDTQGAGLTFYAGGTPVGVGVNDMAPIIGGGGFDGDGMQAVDTEFSLDERDLAIAPDAFYVSTEDHAIRRIDRTTGVVSTIAGDGQPQNAGDGGAATAASIHNPRGLALSNTGVLYVACTGAVRAINVGSGPLDVGGQQLLPGTITTVFASDPAGFLVASDALTVSPTGTVFTVDATSKALVEIDPTTRERTVVVGPGGDYSGDGGLAVDASSPDFDLVLDAAGNLIFGDEAGRIRVVNRQTTPLVLAGVTIQPGRIATIAGTGDTNAGVGDGGPALAAEFAGPQGIALGGSVVYVCDEFSLRMVNTGASATTVNGITIAPGAIETLAGDGSEGYSGDGGDPLLAQLVPKDVAVDTNGIVYVLDSEAVGVRAINVTAAAVTLWGGGIAPVVIQPGEIETVLGGTGDEDWNGDGLDALSTNLTNPETIFLQSGGALFVCDPGARRLRRVDPTTGTVTTVVGTGDAGYNGDAIPLLNVRTAPDELTIDATGRFYLLDGNGRIRSFLASSP